MPKAERRSQAFTLLEVLAAVAVLGILYTVLSSAAMQGLRAEGESRRRLQASLIADAQLADIETLLAAGEAPELGLSELEFDDYLVSVEVTPLELPFEKLAEDEEPGDDGVPDLPSATPGVELTQEALRRISLVVSWSEGAREARVLRTTYAYDMGVLEPLLPPPLSGTPGAAAARADATGDPSGGLTAEDLDLGLDTP